MLGIVILNYMTYEKTFCCIESIKSTFKKNKKIIIVDNNSANDSYFKIKKKYKEDSEITIVKSKENLGYANGNNIGLRMLKEFNVKYVLVCNNDVIFMENSIYKLLQCIQEEEAFAVGAQVLDRNKKRQDDSCRNFFGFKEKLFITTPLKIIDKIKGSPIYNNYYYKDYDYKNRKKVYMLSGCCMLFNYEKFYNLDFFDENTFLYEEEAILFKKAEEHNYKTFIEPKAKIIHFHGETTKKMNKPTFGFLIESEKYYCKNYLKLKPFKFKILKTIRVFQILRGFIFSKVYRNDYKKFLKYIFSKY